MTTSGISEFTIDDLFNYDYCAGSFGFDGLGYSMDPSQVAGPSQPYTGAEVSGNLHDYPDFPSPSTAPTSLYPVHQTYTNEEYNLLPSQGTIIPSLSQTTAVSSPYSPVPTLSHSPSLSPQSHIVPISPTTYPYTQPQVITDVGSLGFDFPTAADGFLLPNIHPFTVDSSPRGELWQQYSHQYPGPDYRCLDIPPFVPPTSAAQPEVPLPQPALSSSGPQRTRQSARERRRYNPTKAAKKDPGSKRDGWGRTLVRFRAKLDAGFGAVHNVHNGQPSGGLVPEVAFAKVTEIVKEDLKRSPLQDTKAGEGKRSRNVEKYLEGLLQVLLPVVPSISGSGSDESDTAVAALSRLADELEKRLAVANQQPTLRQATSAIGAAFKTGSQQVEKQAKRSRAEKARRDHERHHLERISRLFRTSGTWSKKEVLNLAVIFLLYGPTIFSPCLLEVRPAL